MRGLVTGSILGGLLLLGASPAGAAPPAPAAALKTYKKEMSRILLQERRYETKDMKRDLREAYAAYIKPWLDRGKPNAPKEIEYDFSGYRWVYKTWWGFALAKGEAAKKLAAAGGTEAAKRLLAALLRALDEVVKEDRALAQSRPVAFSMHDQVPAIRRYAALTYRDALVSALGSLKDGAALSWLLGKGLESVAKWQRSRRSDLARIALLDALARTGAAAVKPLLVSAAESASRRLRIVGLEGLARLPEERRALRERLTGALLTDPCFAVRVAALEALSRTAAGPAAVPARARALETEIQGENGILRTHLRNALRKIVGRDLGDAPESWLAWYRKHEKAIRDGTWQKGGDEGGTVKDERETVSFYDIRTISKRILALIDASDTLIIPVDIELAKTKNFFEWNALAKKDRNYVSQYDLLKRETLGMVEKLRPGSRFNLLLMNGSNQLTPFCKQGMAAAGARAKKEVAAFLDHVVVGGWAPQIEGLLEASRMAGTDPWGGEPPDAPAVDTIFLLSDGVPSGGPIVYGPAIVDDVRRRHRFLRIVIHTIRIGDFKDTAEEVMKGIAEATGGKYTWRKKP